MSVIGVSVLTGGRSDRVHSMYIEPLERRVGWEMTGLDGTGSRKQNQSGRSSSSRR